MADVVLKDKSGTEQTYTGVEQVELTNTDGESEVFISERLIQNQVQSDWLQFDDTQPDCIKNKPCYYLSNRGSVTYGSGLELYEVKIETANPNIYSADELANDRLTFHSSSNTQKAAGVYETVDDIPTGSSGLVRIPNEKLKLSKAELTNGFYSPVEDMPDAIFGGYYLYSKSSSGKVYDLEKIFIFNKPFPDPICIWYKVNDSGYNCIYSTIEDTGIVMFFTPLLGSINAKLTPLVFNYDLRKLKKLDEAMLPDSVAKKTDIIDSYTKDESDTALKAVEDKIPSLEGYYTKAQTDEAVQAVEDKIPNLEGYYTKDETDAAISEMGKSIPSLEGYCKETQLSEAISAVEKKIPSLANYYTKNEVVKQLAAILPEFSSADNGKVLGIQNGKLAWMTVQTSGSGGDAEVSVDGNILVLGDGSSVVDNTLILDSDAHVENNNLIYDQGVII